MTKDQIAYNLEQATRAFKKWMEEQLSRKPSKWLLDAYKDTPNSCFTQEFLAATYQDYLNYLDFPTNWREGDSIKLTFLGTDLLFTKPAWFRAVEDLEEAGEELTVERIQRLIDESL